MVEQKIELRKVRDFGENLSDTFQFIRQEFKPLLKAFLAFSGLFIVAYGITMVLFQQELSSTVVKNDEGLLDIFKSIDKIFTPLYFINLCLANLTMTSLAATFACYFKIYDDKGGESPTLDELCSMISKWILPFFVYNILLFIVLFIGILLCVIPGFYLWVVTAPIYFVMVAEDLSFFAAFSKCFTLIKEQFWSSFGIYFVVMLIIVIGGGIIELVMGIVAGAVGYLTIDNIEDVTVAVSGVLTIFSYVFYIVYFVSVALNYYSLSERMDGGGLMRKINNIGSGGAHSNIEEQY